MARYLVVSHLTAGSPEFTKKIRNLVQVDPGAEFTLLVPTSPPGHRLVWNDAEAMRAARYRADAAGELMRECGARVTRTAVGARDPLSAIGDEIREHPPYDEIIICTLPAGISRWLKLDLVSRARQHTRLPVTHVVVQQEWLPPREIPAEAVVDSPAAEEAAPIQREPAEVTAELMTAAGAGLELTDAALSFEQAIRQAPGLEPALAALVALRVAQLRQCEYTWHEAVAVARTLGMPDDRIAALDHWRASEHVRFDDRERAALGLVDAICKGRDGIRAAREVLKPLASDGAIVAIALLAGWVRTQGDLAAAFAFQPGEAFVGWELYAGEGVTTL